MGIDVLVGSALMVANLDLQAPEQIPARKL
jgi:hypothetical protein